MIIKNKFGKFKISGNRMSWGVKPENWIELGTSGKFDIGKVLVFQFGLRVLLKQKNCDINISACYDVYLNEDKKNTWEYTDYVVYRGYKSDK